MNKAVFFDRDGTINYERHYLNDPKKLKLFKGVSASLLCLQQHGWKIIVVTNQAGIARGYVKIEELNDIHQKLVQELAKHKVKIDKIYHCPHHPDSSCKCRKPMPGMVNQAQKDFDLDLNQCWVVGDRESDIGLGQAIGAKTILVLTGYGKRTLKQHRPKVDYVVRSLPYAVNKILQEESYGTRTK